jgi:hypothetical protein
MTMESSALESAAVFGDPAGLSALASAVRGAARAALMDAREVSRSRDDRAVLDGHTTPSGHRQRSREIAATTAQAEALTEVLTALASAVQQASADAASARAAFTEIASQVEKDAGRIEGLRVLPAWGLRAADAGHEERQQERLGQARDRLLTVHAQAAHDRRDLVTALEAIEDSLAQCAGSLRR